MPNVIYDPNELLTENQVSQLYKVSPRTLQTWRCIGKGPKFVKVSSKAVRYRMSELSAWSDLMLRQSTSDNGISQK